MKDSSYDVAVIGLGAMGAATLYQLARRGVRVVGIDRYAPPHDQGSSHGDTRITRQAVGEGPAYVPLAVRSQRLWREIEALTGEDLFEQCGVLVMSSTKTSSHHGRPDFTEATIALARTHGIAHEVLDGRAIRARFPQFGGLPDDTLGYLEPGGGFVRPERCIAAQLQLAARHGATLRTGEPVTALRSEGGTVEIATDAGTIRARHAIVCAGMWTAPLLGAPFDRLLRVNRQVLHWFEVAEPSVFAAASPTFILFHGPGDIDSCYGFPPLPGEGSMKVATEQYALATPPDALDRRTLADESATMFRDHLAGRFEGVLPRALRTAVCTYTVTPDSGFIIDRHPRLDGVTVVSACSGHGFKHSAAIGEALAKRHLGEADAINLAPFSLARFG